MHPGLNGALFAQRSEAKKREWKTEKGAQTQDGLKNPNNCYLYYINLRYEHHTIYFSISQTFVVTGTETSNGKRY